MATTLGSNINSYPSSPVNCVRAGVEIVPVRVTFGGTGLVSLVSAPIAVSVASAAAGVINITVPSGLAIELFGQPTVWPIASNQSLTNWVPFNKSLTSGTFQLVRWQENASGTSVSGVNGAAGDAISFFIYIHSQTDGGAI